MLSFIYKGAVSLLVAAALATLSDSSSRADEALPVLTSLRQIRELPQAEARKGYPVELTAIVTCFDASIPAAFLQAGDEAIYARYPLSQTRLKPGDRVTVKALTLGGIHNFLTASTITPVAFHAALPEPVVLTGDRFYDLLIDSRRAVATGVVENVRVDGSKWIVSMRREGRPFVAFVVRPPRASLNPPDWIGTRVAVTGPLSVQQPGTEARQARIFCQSTEDVRLIDGPGKPIPARIGELNRWAGTDQWLSLTGRVTTATQRALTISDGTGEISLPATPFARVGDEMEVTGFASGTNTLSSSDARLIERDAKGVRRRVVTSIAELKAMSASQADEHLSVRMRGVITFCEAKSKEVFIHDGVAGAFVWLEKLDPNLRAGDEAEVTGRTGAGLFAPIIDAATIAKGRRAELPAPKSVTLADLLTGRDDSSFIEIAGVVRRVYLGDGLTHIDVATAGGKFSAWVAAHLEDARALQHAQVRIAGVAGGKFNEHRQIIGVFLFVPDLQSITVDEAAPADPFSAPRVRLHDVFRYQPGGDISRRVLVSGTVTWEAPKGGLYLSDGEESLFVDAPLADAIHIGSRVEAVGYPSTQSRFAPTLDDALIRIIGNGQAMAPQKTSSDQLRNGSTDATLVKLRARLIESHKRDGIWHSTWTSVDDGGLNFEASLNEHAALRLEPNTIADLTGIVRTLMNDERKPAGFELLLRDANDIAIISAPGWWTAERMWRALFVLGFILAGALMAVIVLRRKVAEKTGLLKDQLSKEEGLQQQYRTLFENNPHPMWVFDPKTLRFLAVNETAMRRYGYSREEFLAISVLDIRPAEEREKIRNLIEKTGGQVTDGTVCQHQRKDGTRFFVEITAREISFQGKSAVLTLAHDITQRHEAEQAVRLSEAKFRRVVESSLIGVVFFKGDGTITDANDCFLTMVGRSRDDLRKGLLNGSNFAPADRAQRHQNAMNHLRAHGTAPATRREILRADGSRGPAMVGAVALDGTDGYVAFVLDLTKEAALEQQVVLAQKMEAVGLLAGGVAHDFNNLLQVIQGYTLVSLEALDANATELRENLDQVKSASERAAELTRQLLFFSRQDNLKQSVVDVADIVEDTLKLVRRVIGEHIEVKFLTAPNLPKIRGDRGRIEQVLMNLCVNARDAMPKGGRLTIDLSTATLTEGEGAPIGQVGGQYVCLRVTDTGCGMDAATLARIYEPFFTTKSKDKGSGLGLSIVYGIVERHKGVIRVHSKVGAGTTFTVYFPATAAVEGKGASIQPQSADIKGMETILLVEDEPAVRMLAARVLKRAGYDVREAADGAEACDVFKEHSSEIDLVLMDVIMPKMGGRDAYENIVKTRGDIPVIFCSGYSERELGADFLQQHDLDLLPKPYRPEELLTRVRERLHTSQP